MALTGSEVVVAGSGHIYTAPEATAFPTGLAAPSASWTELGYTDEDGVTITRSRSSDDLNVWQSAEPVRKLITGVTMELSFVLRQFNPINLATALGGGDFTDGATFGTFVLPLPSDVDVLAMVIDGLDGSTQVRWLIERVQVSGDIEIHMNAQDSVNLPVTMNALASTNPPKILSNAAPFLTP